jgi:hypothetical protein
MRLKISSKETVKKLGICIFFLVAIHVAIQMARIGFGYDQLGGLTHVFDLDDEFNIPSLFSLFLFGIVSVLLGLIAHYSEQEKKPYYIQWAGMAVIFFWLGFDEILSIHEPWEPILRSLLHTKGIFYYIWQLPYLIFFLGIISFYIPFWKDLNPKIRLQMIWSAVFYLTAVIVLESLGGRYYALHSLHDPVRDPIYITFSTIEETFEMIGLTIFIHSLLEYIRLEVSKIEIFQDS